MTHIGTFLKYNCYPDILRILDIKKNVDKEISEAMAVHKFVKRIVLAHPEREYIHIDFCSGNALAPVLSAFTLPVKLAVAIDRKERDRDWNSIKKFSYFFRNIFDINFLQDLIVYSCFDKEHPVIFTGIHACQNLTPKIIEIFNQFPIKEKHLVLMPCCIGKLEDNNIPTLIKEKLGRDFLWAWQNYNKIETEDKNIFQDEKCLSPRNIILYAKQG